uniref:VPS37 C-terminal domain-containing protein n=1 Tax=Heterorhabditis bacteriophora TaxID=37862 RepID=A0A1I7X6C8_HETBA
MDFFVDTLYIPLSQPSSSAHYVEQFNHQQQPQEPNTDRVDNQISHSVDHSLGLGPSMMLATTDSETVRLQKSVSIYPDSLPSFVLLLQQEVLTLKREYLKAKLLLLRREQPASETRLDKSNNGSQDNITKAKEISNRVKS